MSSIVIRPVHKVYLIISFFSALFLILVYQSYITAYLNFVFFIFDVTHLMAQTVCPIQNAKFARFEVLSAFDEIQVARDVMPCRLVNGYRRFEGCVPSLRNVVKYSPNDTASHRRRVESLTRMFSTVFTKAYH